MYYINNSMFPTSQLGTSIKNDICMSMKDTDEHYLQTVCIMQHK